ncbi:transposase [Paenibacillus sp. N3.4]|uniref:transposase n=1 Tax=Paenibacillus sp. N3.4 TaxID=2603222 RepID=UPI0021C2595D|nr:transposase [Paenibacillus sp. N3.4]
MFWVFHKMTPGIIAGLHTFGSRLNFNPHIHMLVTMGGMKANGEWKTYDDVPFEMLRKQWQTVVLKLIRRSLNEEERATGKDPLVCPKCECY